MILPIDYKKDIKLRKDEFMYELKPIEYFRLLQYLEVEVFEKEKFICSISIPVQIWQNDEALECLIINVVRGLKNE
jgi:hypothetical protein